MGEGQGTFKGNLGTESAESEESGEMAGVLLGGGARTGAEQESRCMKGASPDEERVNNLFVMNDRGFKGYEDSKISVRGGMCLKHRYRTGQAKDPNKSVFGD